MKSHFKTSEITMKRVVGVDVWRVGEPVSFYSELLAAWIDVPVGFETDFASIPRFLHRLLPKNGEYDAPAIVHDWLYSHGIYHKDTADKIFLEALTSINVAPWKRRAMYRAVAMFGGKAWNDHRNTERTE